MREVPPWLRHLRTDRRGLPVPYVNLWGVESDLSRIRLAHDRHVGRVAVFFDDDFDGAPDFTRQNMQRQRECMMAGLCQVCGRGVPWSRRFLVYAEMSTQVVEAPGLGRAVVVTEPWLDQRCAEFAVGKCPDLIRRCRDEALVMLAVTSKQQVQMVEARGWVDGPLEEQSRRELPTMWVKVAAATPRQPG